MPAGAAGARAVAAGASKGFRAGGPPQFWLRDREFAIVRLLATGADDDLNYGAGQIHEANGNSMEWEPCPTGYDDVEGKCRCPDLDKKIWTPKYRFGIHLFVLRQFNMEQAKNKDGTVPEWAKDWEQMPISNEMRNLVRQVDRFNRDPDDGLRWVSNPNRYRIWFRGVGFNNQFLEDIEALRTFMPGGNLSARNVLIARKPSAPGKEIPQPTWTIREAPEGIDECNVPLTDDVIAEIKKWYAALPPVGDYFKGTFKWPLFDEEKDVSKVPDEPEYEQQPAAVAAAPSPEPEPQPVAAAPAASAEPRESPTPVNPPVPAEIQSEGLKSFLLGQ